MGYGRWSKEDFVRYNTVRGRIVTASGDLDHRLTDQQIFVQKVLNPRLDPKNVMRECLDSEDHPHSLPVILALDVTGSMGPASAQVAKKLNEVMTSLYDQVKDVEFMVMGIGDLAYDKAPIQISQFESDIRIAEQLDLVFMEHGGGGNGYESYSAAWYMALNHTKLDCLKRGEKGLIITMGDEPLNPYLPREPLAAVTGDLLEADVETNALYREASGQFDIWHLHVNHKPYDHYWPRASLTFGGLLPEGHLLRVTIDDISQAIVGIVKQHAKEQQDSGTVSWSVEPAPAPAAPPQEPVVGEISWDTTPASVPEVKEETKEKGKEEDKKKKGLFGLFSW